VLNRKPIVQDGRFVLYWMQQSQRSRFNHALEYAIERANELRKPPVVVFGLMDDYPQANERHYAFMLEGLVDTARQLEKRGIRFVLKRGQPQEVAVHFASQAALLVCDRGYLRHQRRWRDHVADRAPCLVVQVESDVVVPVEVVSDKAEFAARTIRPKIHRLLKGYLTPLSARRVSVKSLDLHISGDPITLEGLKLDRSVGRVSRFKGGESEARRLLDRFVQSKLSDYDDARNEPAAEATSLLSPYLHFGQISPLEIALAAGESDKYLEELIVRRELSMNFVQFQPKYDSYEGLPEWAKRTLDKHRSDIRPQIYTRQQLEAGQTSDRWWNAAQREMVRSGFMHNTMRMYWGKKILEWSATPEEAFQTALELNNTCELDGRDPNSYAGVAWVFGLHDRPWGERPIFGQVRYMNAAGLQRKFDMEAYARRVIERFG
jgi:deoxyribodipyrimidine photo-lyase